MQKSWTQQENKLWTVIKHLSLCANYNEAYVKTTFVHYDSVIVSSLGRILFGIMAKAVGLRTTFIDVTDHNVKCRITFQILNTNIQLTRNSLVA